jgi:hypothetical protein
MRSRPEVSLPLAPPNPLPYRQQVKAKTAFHTGLETLRDAGGPVTRLRLGPNWLMPQVVAHGRHPRRGRVAGSPQGTPLLVRAIWSPP